MNSNLEQTENGKAVSAAHPAIPTWPVHDDGVHTVTPTPAGTHKDGMETDELPPATGSAAESSAKTFTFQNPRGCEPVDWDGTEENLPRGDAKKMLVLRFQYLHSAFVEQVFKSKAERTEFLRRAKI